MKKGDVTLFRKMLKLWPDGTIFNRLALPNEYQDKWIMNDLVKRGFLIDLDHNSYQKTTRKVSFHKRKHRTTDDFIGRAGQAFRANFKRVADMTEMRSGQNGGVPATYQEIADRFNVSRQRVEQILVQNGVAGRVPLRDPNFLTTTEAATYLTVSYRSVRDWAVTGTLPFYQKQGKVGHFLFKREDLDTYKQQKLLTPRRNRKENQGLKPMVVRLLQLGDHPKEIAQLSGVGISTVYEWMYQMPGRDKRVGLALKKILSTGEERGTEEST